MRAEPDHLCSGLLPNWAIESREAEAYEKLLKKRPRKSEMDALYCLAPTAGMGLAPGGLMKQEIYKDPHGLDKWETSASSRCFVHIVNSLQYKAITGANPPAKPSYSQAVHDCGPALVRLLRQGVGSAGGRAGVGRPGQCGSERGQERRGAVAGERAGVTGEREGAEQRSEEGEGGGVLEEFGSAVRRIAIRSASARAGRRESSNRSPPLFAPVPRGARNHPRFFSGSMLTLR